jgi:hypothetical protein
MAKGTRKLEIIITATSKQATRVFKALKKGMRGVVSAGAKVGAGIAAGFAVATAAVIALTNKVLQLGDDLGKTADRLGVTTEELSSLRHAGQLAGLAINDIDRALQFMQRNLAEAVDGTSTQADAFDKLGISLENIQKLSPADQMQEIVGALEDIEDQSTRVQVAMDIFGRSGAQVLNMTAGGLAEARKEAEMFGIAMSRADAKQMEKINDSITRVKAAIQGAAISLVKQFSPALETVTGKIAEFAKGGELKLWATQTALVMVQAFQGAIATVGVLGEAIILAGRGLNELKKGAAVMAGGFAAAEIKLLDAKLKNTEKLLEVERQAEREDGVAREKSKQRLIDEIMQIQTSIEKYRALADASVETYDDAGRSADQLAKKQGTFLEQTDKAVSFLEKQEEKIKANEEAQQKVVKNTAAAKSQMSGLADETERAVIATQRLATISANIKIPEGQKVLTNEGIRIQGRTEGE